MVTCNNDFKIVKNIRFSRKFVFVFFFFFSLFSVAADISKFEYKYFAEILIQNKQFCIKESSSDKREREI